MANDDDTDDADEHDGSDPGHSAPAADPVLIALQLCALANNKTVAAAIQKLAKLDRQFADTQAKVTALAAQAEQINAALDTRAAGLDERDRALDARDAAFASQATDVRDELREHHARLEQTHRQLIHRIMSTTGILGEWNWNLQSPPTWEQLRRMIADLPEDLPASAAEPGVRIDAFSDVCGDERADRHGTQFLGTLTRDVSHRGAQ
jgi:hypothetical protein